MLQSIYLQMVRKNNFEKVYRTWKEKKVTQREAAALFRCDKGAISNHSLRARPSRMI